MPKLIVKDPKTGATRPMTQSSYDLAGKKRGFKIVGYQEQPIAEKSEVQLHMDRLRAEKAAKEAEAAEVSDKEEVKEAPKKRGPKAKSQQNAE